MRYKLLMLSPLIVSLGGLPSCSEQDEGIDLRNPSVKAYLEAKNEKEMCEILLSAPYNGDQQNYSIDFEDYDHYEHTIELSLNADFSDSFTLQTFRNSINPSCLIPGNRYFYRIFGDNDFASPIKEGEIKWMLLWNRRYGECKGYRRMGQQ